MAKKTKNACDSKGQSVRCRACKDVEWGTFGWFEEMPDRRAFCKRTCDEVTSQFTTYATMPTE